MKLESKSIWDILTQSDKYIYRVGRRALIALCFVTGISLYFPTTHNGDIVDRIWTNLRILGPLLFLLVFLFLYFKARKDAKKESCNSKEDF